MKRFVFEITVSGGECKFIELPLSETIRIKKIIKHGRNHTDFTNLHIDKKYMDVNPQRDCFSFDIPVRCKFEVSFKVWNRDIFQEKIIIEIWGD